MRKQGHFLIIFAFLLSAFVSGAQTTPPVKSDFQNDLETIIKDYPNSFHQYIGDELVANPQSTDYSSLLKVSGAEDCRIIEYPSRKRNRYSFQAIMLTTDDFETAKNSFLSFYKQVNNLYVKAGDSRAFQLQGLYEEPSEEKKFTSTLFSTGASTENPQRLKVELLMEYALMEWQVKVLVYEKEREDDERGETKSL